MRIEPPPSLPRVLGGRAEPELAELRLAEWHQAGGEEHPGEVAVAYRGPADERVAALLGRHAGDVDVVLQERRDAREEPAARVAGLGSRPVEGEVGERAQLGLEPLGARDGGLDRLGYRDRALLDRLAEADRVEAAEGVITERVHAGHGDNVVPEVTPRRPAGCRRPPG